MAELQKQHPDELFNLLSRVVPYLRSSKWDTRMAAAAAVAGIVDNTPKFDPNEDEDHTKNDPDPQNGANGATLLGAEYELLQLASLDIEAILTNGKKLFRSAGKEYDIALGAMDPAARLAHQKKSLNSRLGLGGEFLEDELLLSKDGDTNGFSAAPQRVDAGYSELSHRGAAQSPTPVASRSPRGSVSAPSLEESGLSKRQLNQLKRKSKADAKNQARKVRVLDLGGTRQAADVVSTPVEQPVPKPEVKSEDGDDIKKNMFDLDRTGGDDDSKVVAEYKGAIAPEKSEFEADQEDLGLEWPFEKLCDILAVDLLDHNWEVRHGAAMGLREVIRVHGHGAARRRGKSRAENDALNQAYLDDLACRYCCVLMLDRFGDFISDTVVAPIRETVGQALGTLLIHLPQPTLEAVYLVLYRLVMQKDLGLSRRMWEVCHGGMLGLKYLGVVRRDILVLHLDGIVEAVMKGLTDPDDDVRAVGAATLIPIADELVKLKPDVLNTLINIVWDCLADLSDDLSASIGNIMDLLAKLCTYDQVIMAMVENARVEADGDGFSEYSFKHLVPRLFPFFRHTIASVRSAVLRALLTFMRIESDQARSWIEAKVLRLIFQNLAVERYEDVLELSYQVWNKLGDLLVASGSYLSEFQVHCDSLLLIALHPVGVSRHPIPMDYSLIMKPSGQYLAEPAAPRKQSSPSAEPATKKRRRSDRKEEPVFKGHNLDGHMLQGDIDLVGLDTMIRSRTYTAKGFGRGLALAYANGLPDAISARLASELNSNHATTRVNASMIIEEYLRSLHDTPELGESLTNELRAQLEAAKPEAYSELVGFLQVARAQCQSLLNTFRDQGKVPGHKIPTIAVIVQGDAGAGPNAFSVADARKIINEDFERMKKSMSAAQRLTSAQHLSDARANVAHAVEAAEWAKVESDVRIRAAAAGALVVLRDVPKKPGSLIKSLMDSVKSEENFDLQKRSARSVALLVELYAGGIASSKVPADKVVGNLTKFYCVDTSDTPEFPPNAEFRDAILSLRKEEDRKDHADAARYEKEAKAARVTRRGAKETIDKLSATFGAELFTHASTLKTRIQEPLREVFAGDPEEMVDLDEVTGQSVVDAFSVLRLLAPSLHESLHPFVDEMMSFILKALRCKYSVIRYAAAKCFATVCSVWPVKGMTTLVESVLPMITNPRLLHRRQGAIECAYHLIHIMEDSILPYVVFLIVPILGRMSDSNGEIRLLATTSFATLVKLVPLEAGIPDPPGFSEELLKGRDKERKFVAQMLDPKKTEPFDIPVAIKATLRSYQQDGVNWLAFLNRFNLHGVLCDDMGLGKTLQTLCMVASDHHLRAEEFAKTQSEEVRKLPSLIICPPTLSGHWQQEIQTFAPFLTSVAYVGPPASRSALKPRLSGSDIVITSYEIIRNDLDIFAPLSWNYCVLDEGHLIKNPRAKTSVAVKQLTSNHRLILSGTPIQNNVLELWSLFDFLMPGFLGTEKVFQDRFAKPIAASRNAKSSSKEQERGALAIESLHKQVLPFLLRRLKEEVLEDLPPKIVQNYYCDLSELQKKLFDDFARKERKEIERKAGSDDKEAKQHIFQALQYMRKLCNSPSLVMKETHPHYNSTQASLKAQNSSLRDIAHAPKLGALRDLLLDCGIGKPAPPDGELGTGEDYVSQHRALVFCQMKEMLDIVQNDVLKKLLPSVQYLRLDGGVEAGRRQSIVNQFNSDPSFDVLLLTTSVGGLGLNLTGADTVIFVEHDWNPQKDMQAMDRAHRIGQKKVVNVYRLITRGTLEEKILNLQRFKIDVASTVVNQQNAGLGTMETDQILDLFSIDAAEPGDATGRGREEDLVDETGEVREKGKKGLLDDLPEMWDEGQYKEEYNLDSFLAKMA